MKPCSNSLLFLLLFVLILSQGCNTLYNTKMIDIEIVEPGNVKFPANYKNIAVRYNNTNIAHNDLFAKHYIEDKVIEDAPDLNLDSLASFVYYDYFIQELLKNDFFESFEEIEPQDFSNISVIDSVTKRPNFRNLKDADYDEVTGRLCTSAFGRHLRKYPIEKENKTSQKYLDANLNLYSKEEIKAIADSTQADILLSFDHFISLNGKTFQEFPASVVELVQINSFWSAYDLHDHTLKFYIDKKDTIIWSEYATTLKQGVKLVPKRRDAVLNAADICGTKLANYLIPHWVPVKRMYYESGHVDLKQTNDLVEEGKWMEAAKVWKSQLENPNKNIVAKCMFNLGVACEMEGKLNTALEWVVKSYHVFGNKNVLHADQCTEYIRILSQRKLDFQRLDEQY